MQRLWTIVLGGGKAHPKPIFGRDQAIVVACNMISKGVAVRAIAPVAMVSDDEMIGEAELLRIARERNNSPTL